MPKGVSKERNELISGKGCYAFLTERDDTQKKLMICNKLLDSLLKTRSGGRRDKYVTDIRNCFKKLCIQSTDLLLLKKRSTKELQETKQDLSRESRKRADLRDKLTEAEYKNSQMSEYKSRFEDQRESTLKSEQNCGELLRENDILKETIARLKEQNKELKKELKRALTPDQIQLVRFRNQLDGKVI